MGNRREVKAPNRPIAIQALPTKTEKTGTRTARSEHNKKRRLRLKESKSVCFNCREKGHSATYCPQNPNVGICYNCGSNDHAARNCDKPTKGNMYSHANCFICGEKGHLASACPKNEHGLYPNGGGCKICGENTHLSRDCKTKKEEVREGLMLGKLDASQGADDDDFHIISEEKKAPKALQRKTTKKKVVAF